MHRTSCIARSTSSGAWQMGSVTLDAVDQGLLRALQLDGRAAFSLIARQLGVSERTVGRRYGALRTLGLRVVGQPVPARLGMTRWLLRIQCTPDSAGTIAGALARRADTSWISLASGGTELYCAVTTPGPHERDALLLDKLPRTPHLVQISAHCLLRLFTDITSTWYATGIPFRRRGTGAGGAPPPRCDVIDLTAPLGLDDIDHALVAALAEDGRAGLPELAAAAGCSPSSIQRRLQRLRSQGALGFCVDFAPRHLGYHLMTHLWLRVAPGELSAIGRALASHPEIAFAAATTGPHNLVASGVFRGDHDLYDYLDRRIGSLAGVQAIETAPILREVKRLTR
ncbi:Lrp/AsnC family transcriptional regulator [Streptomyces sp. VNUA116]|uniref:Lrp/AsnC family transcriptional regulator n=1 Tax=Streptomyces sp. VNUA116 TaxID=3062449 RepID=UPI0026758E3C|nr:Lrp/AsnC family transcriptional regulator [Streptomyces sp. VNUA116]WKU42939.1 Lrp/AsnC family transcriptional regulator [Streptomyces sp. VNUA116]